MRQLWAKIGQEIPINVISSSEKSKVAILATHPVMENTVFANPSFIWKCTVQQDPSNLVDGETEVYVSERRLQAYQCTRNANGWTVEDLGEKYAVFDDKEDHYHFIDETLKADHVSIR